MTAEEIRADTPDLTVAELEQIRNATLRTYEGGDEQYNTLPPHLLKVVDGDGGLVHMIDLAILRTRQLDALRAQVQQDYAAIHAKQQRDQALIDALEEHVREEGALAGRLQDQLRAACADGSAAHEHIRHLDDLVHEYHKALMAVTGGTEEVGAGDGGVDRTIVPPGTIAKMRAENPGPSPEFREAIARARQRRENNDG
ncbi:hypothetical protein [Nocardia ignorata]|uniref:Uncharacterized protein n=1 Tax=Nocardia ignorata TaxID=145285 RepID=A0A4R6NYM8_NOCIG|nr:hypothetical protein [Nocardia ignorata]TDP29886.1 hypothetical protein DFR75_112155 [Nocardia ignorata]